MSLGARPSRYLEQVNECKTEAAIATQ